MQLSARVLLILLSLMVIVTGCEKRVVEEPGLVGFQLLSPVANSNVTSVDSLKMKVKYSGKASLATVYFELNGADITSEFADGNNVSDLFVADMAKLRSALVQGTNTLIASHKKMDINNQPILDGNGNAVFDASYTFTFFFDDEAPRLTIDTVVPSATNPDGTPLAGTSIDVTGKVIDASTVTSITFTYPGGNKSLLSVNSAILGNNQFNSATGQYKVTLLNYPTVASATTVAHFSYTAKDSFKHTRTEQFMASGTAINQAAALQVNATLASNIAPIANSLINNGFILAQSQNIFGLGKPLKLGTLNTSPVPGDLIESPLVNCLPSVDLPGVKECRPYGTTRIFVYPSNSTQCGSMLFNSSAGVTDCVVFIKNITFDTPSVDVKFNTQDNALLATLELWIKYASIEIEVAGIRVVGVVPFADTYYLGGLQGEAQLNKFTIDADIQLSPDSTHLINIQRVSPFRLNLPDLLQVPKLIGTCNICSPLVSPLTMIILALGTDVNGNGVIDKKEVMSKLEEAINNKASPILDSALTNLLVSNTKTKEVEDVFNVVQKQVVGKASVVNNYTVYNNNAHFVMNGVDKVDPQYYTPEYMAVNGGLGSTFATQGKYYSNLIPSVKGWPITLAGQKNLDISFAVSANSVNQWLLANHQTGMFEETTLPLKGADFVSANPLIDPLDDLSLTFKTHQAPSVLFKSIDTSSLSVCVNQSLCAINSGTSPGAITLTINDLDVKLHNDTDADTELEANINVELTVELGVIAGLPSIELKPNSVRVTVNSTVVPATGFSKPRLARNIEKGIELIMSSQTIKDKLGQKVRQVSVSSLTGSGGSGINCASASVDGEFCIQGTQVSYSSLLTGTLPIDYDVVLRWLTIEKGGSYLSVGLDVRNRPGGPPPGSAPASDAFMTWQVTN